MLNELEQQMKSGDRQIQTVGELMAEHRGEAGCGTKRYREGVNHALYCIARQLGVESRDIRKAGVSVEKKAAALARRIREQLAEGDDAAGEAGGKGSGGGE